MGCVIVVCIAVVTVTSMQFIKALFEFFFSLQMTDQRLFQTANGSTICTWMHVRMLYCFFSSFRSISRKRKNPEKSSSRIYWYWNYNRSQYCQVKLLVGNYSKVRERYVCFSVFRCVKIFISFCQTFEGFIWICYLWITHSTQYDGLLWLSCSCRMWPLLTNTIELVHRQIIQCSAIVQYFCRNNL